MKKFTLISSFIFVLSLTLNAQLNYLKLDFDGSAEDLSYLNLDCQVYGATLSEDRFGNSNSAYYFDGVDDYITASFSEGLNGIDSGNFALSFWFNTSITSTGMLFQKGSNSEYLSPQFWCRFNDITFNKDIVFLTADGNSPSDKVYSDNSTFNNGEWHHLLAQRVGDTLELYIDTKLLNKSFTTKRNVNDTIGIIIGAQNPEPNHQYIRNYYNGYIDDIRLFTTSLSANDIDDLYTEEECTGYTIDTINVYDTITIYDTITVYDTIYITEEDTLKIAVSDLSQLSEEVEIVVYPNPTNSTIYIDNADLSSTSGYKIRLLNNSSKIIFESELDQQNYQINLSDFGRTGLYYLQVYNSDSEILSTKKIILQKE